MCFLIQVGLFGGASLITWVICGIAHAPLWAGCAGAAIFFLATWITYLHYQRRHPDFWCPWDDGLPREMRMVNAFVPAIGVFCAVLFLVPIFQKAKDKALAARQKVEARRGHGIITPYARPRQVPSGRPRTGE